MYLPSKQIIYRNTLCTLFGLIIIQMISSSPYPVVIDEVKVNILFIAFQFIPFILPFRVYLVLLMIFSLLMEKASGSPTGFYVFIYSLSLLGPIYFINKNIYHLNFTVFFFYLLITGSLKTLVETLLLFTIYESAYIYHYFSKIGIKEFFLNLLIALLLYLFLFTLKRAMKMLYTLFVHIKQL